MDIFHKSYELRANKKEIYDCFESRQYQELMLDQFETNYSWEYWNDLTITPTIISEWRNLEEKMRSVVESGKKVLSIGGGGTSNTHRMLGENCELFVVLNPSIWDLERVPELKNIKNLRVRGLGEKTPFKNNTFDVIEIPATIDHCREPQEVLKECLRILRNSGLVALTCGNSKSYYRSVLGSLNIRIKDAHSHSHSWHTDPVSLESLLRGVGFQEVEVVTTAYLKLPKWIERRINSKISLLVHNYISNTVLPRVIGKGKGGMIFAKARAIK
jgi:ubiquinone/menaquinone biosynthesis C-methylase UbiE